MASPSCAADIPAGPPVLIANAGGWKLIVGSAVLLVVLLARNFIADSYAFQAPKIPVIAEFLSYKMFSNDALASALLALLGVAYVYRQIGLSYRPHLTYSATICRDADFCSPEAGKKFWRVQIANYGTGSAILSQVYYAVTIVGSPELAEFDSFENARKSVTKKLKEFDEFVLYRYSSGAAIPTNSPMKIFEAEISSLRNVVRQIDIVVFYKGAFGGTFAKRIRCIPDYWA